MVTCQTTGTYPRDNVQFSIVSGNADVVTLTDATDLEEETGGTFTEELSVSVEFIREYNANPLKCIAVYDGPGDNGTHDTEIVSQSLDVLVRCKSVDVHNQGYCLINK